MSRYINGIRNEDGIPFYELNIKPSDKSYFVQNRDHVFGYGMGIIFLFSYFVLPQYFGINLPGFDLTAQRFVILLALAFILINKKRAEVFFDDIKKLPFLPGVLCYLFVLLYTAVFRTHVGTIMYGLIEFLGLFVFMYIVRYELGVANTIRLLTWFSYLLGVLGVIEFVLSRSLFSYMETIRGLYTGRQFRSGSYRIMGPANHALGYGLMLIVMLAIACFDLKKNKINVFNKPFLLLLLILNIFLTGSRSTLAVAVLEILVFIILSDKETKKRNIITLLFAIVFLAFFVIATYGTKISNLILLQITSVLDEILGTTWSLKFGADIRTLSNSSDYRKYLPKILTLPSLNPLLGRGSQARFQWYVDGFFIKSIDNFYIAMYIRYAYPGMIAYFTFMITSIVPMIVNGVKKNSGLFLAMAIGVVTYFVNLWWLDTLQTIKYAYVLIGLFWVSFDNENRLAKVGEK